MTRNEGKNSRPLSQRWREIIGRIERLFSRSEFFTTPDDPNTVRRILAYRFSSEMNASQMGAALNTAGPWRWKDRDTVWYKDEWSATVSGNAIVRIYDEGANFNLSFFFKSRGDRVKEEWEHIHRIILEQIFPALRASDINKDQPNEAPAGWWRTPAK